MPLSTIANNSLSDRVTKMTQNYKITNLTVSTLLYFLIFGGQIGDKNFELFGLNIFMYSNDNGMLGYHQTSSRDKSKRLSIILDLFREKSLELSLVFNL